MRQLLLIKHALCHIEGLKLNLPAKNIFDRITITRTGFHNKTNQRAIWKQYNPHDPTPQKQNYNFSRNSQISWRLHGNIYIYIPELHKQLHWLWRSLASVHQWIQHAPVQTKEYLSKTSKRKNHITNQILPDSKSQPRRGLEEHRWWRTQDLEYQARYVAESTTQSWKD